MNKKILTLTVLASLYAIPTLATDTPWIFTSIIPTKKEMLSISRKETCRPFSPKLTSGKCVKYKQGYVCPQEDSGQFVISTYSSKSNCTKALNKARRLLAKK
jgi:hypothetical protein